MTVSENELLEKHAVPIYNLALRLVGNASDAEDLAQDALLRALRALPNFRGECQLSTWVYRITVNTWKNRVRSEKRRGLWKLLPLDFLFSRDGDEPGPAEPAAADAPLDSSLQTSEDGAQVQKALLELDEESRAVIVLRELQGQSYQEIAEALELPVGTVKSRLSRAREALKQRLLRQVTP
jgi:RNA polymerase sigma-70 factor (ECF subfamily)